VDLRHEVAALGQHHVLALEQDLEVRRPALLRFVGEHLGHDLGEVARQVLGEVHADAAAVDREARRHPERLAAVYFVEDSPKPSTKGTRSFGTFSGGSPGRPAFREYVICNESAIEAWSTGTPEIARTLAAAADLMAALCQHLVSRERGWPDFEDWNAHVALEVWQNGPGADAQPHALYEAALAFPNTEYVPAPLTMRLLVERLRAVAPKGPAIEHRVTAPSPRPSP
jgi:hypothetical protein